MTFFRNDTRKRLRDEYCIYGYSIDTDSQYCLTCKFLFICIQMICTFYNFFFINLKVNVNDN